MLIIWILSQFPNPFRWPYTLTHNSFYSFEFLKVFLKDRFSARFLFYSFTLHEFCSIVNLKWNKSGHVTTHGNFRLWWDLNYLASNITADFFCIFKLTLIQLYFLISFILSKHLKYNCNPANSCNANAIFKTAKIHKTMLIFSCHLLVVSVYKK